MASANRVLPALVLVLILLAFGGVEKAEAVRFCSSPSTRFSGMCFSDTNCASICRTERFPNGVCRGFSRMCICFKPCPAQN